VSERRRRLLWLVLGGCLLAIGVGVPFVLSGPDPCLPIGCPSPFAWSLYLPIRAGSIPAIQAIVLYVGLAAGLVLIARAAAPRWPLLGGSLAVLLALVLAGSIAESSSLTGTWYPPHVLAGGHEGTVVTVWRACDPALLELEITSSSSEDYRVYVTRPPASYRPATSYTTHATLPPGARDTGYHRGTWQLWSDEGELSKAVWLKSGSTVEQWPRAYPLPCF